MEVDQDGKGKGDEKGKGKEGKQPLKTTRIVKDGPGEEEEEWEGGSVAQAGKVYNYVVTAQKPTAVTHSVVGNFTDSNGLGYEFFFIFHFFFIFFFHFFFFFNLLLPFLFPPLSLQILT